jgi:hypothetical protein
MRDIQPVSEYGVVMDEDVAATLKGLPPGGRYAASDLYQRYADVARAAGRSPGHPVALGRTFSRIGMRRVKVTVGGGGRGHKGRGRQIVAWIV